MGICVGVDDYFTYMKSEQLFIKALSRDANKEVKAKLNTAFLEVKKSIDDVHAINFQGRSQRAKLVEPKSKAFKAIDNLHAVLTSLHTREQSIKTLALTALEDMREAVAQLSTDPLAK